MSAASVVTVLGGSSAFTPALAAVLADRADELPALEVRLVGRDPGRTAAVAAACRAVASRAEADHRYLASTDPDRALEGAALVLLQARIGGYAGREHDERFPLAHGFVGDETIGPGGLASAIRSHGTVVAFGRAAAERAPDAPFVVLSNPLGLNVRALREDAGVAALGLCELPGRTLRAALGLLGVDPESSGLAVDYVGLNHQGWFPRIELDGRDLLPALCDRLEAGCDDPLLPIDSAVLRAYRALPLGYLRQLLHREREVAAARARSVPRAAELARIAEALHERWRTAPDAPLPALLFARDMPWLEETVAPAVAALLGGEARELWVSAPNRGYVPALPEDAVVETRSWVDASGARPAPWVGAPPGEDARTRPLVDLLAGLTRFEELALQAARAPSPGRVVAALRAHPLGIDDETARAMVPDVLGAATVPGGRP